MYRRTSVGTDAATLDAGGAGLTIRGEGITVDFGGATLEGSDPRTEPDARVGTGLRIEGRNVTVRNLKVRGYKVGVWAKGVPGLRLENVDASDNWRPRLKSTPEKEDEEDWMSYHRNEANEWLRYGAGVYLEGCDGFEVKGLKVTRGCNGLMMTRCDGGLVWNSSLAYLSGIGLGMYRSSGNRAMHNRLDYCLRGFSYGVYNRGQDSAAILVYEQSNRNTFAYNSATHSGDGFFLWAGQSTMDTGKGGCDDNLVYGNDFSHAATNGIEATFSRNAFADNLAMECPHGVWGGYSHDSRWIGNVFAFDTEGVAIEHGRDILLQDNLFWRGRTAVRLWSNPTQDPAWGYPKASDTRSRDTTIVGNTFSGFTGGLVMTSRTAGHDDGVVFDFTRTSGAVVGPNRYGPSFGIWRFEGPIDVATAEVLMQGAPSRRVEFDADGGRTVTESTETTTVVAQSFVGEKGAYSRIWGTSNGLLPPSFPALAKPEGPYDGDESRFETRWNPLRSPRAGREAFGWRPSALATSLAPVPLPGGMDPFLKPGTTRGWMTMRVDEWGPEDGRAPRLVPLGPVRDDGTQRFAVLGPRGRWRLTGATGVSGAPKAGAVPGEITVARSGTPGERRIELTYVGGETTDHRGIVTPAGRAVAFGWSAFEVPIAWDVSFTRWDERLDANDPGRHPQRAFAGEIVHRERVAALDYAGASFYPGGPSERFATVAEGRVEITADDGVRAVVDGKTVLDEWHYQGPTTFRVPLTAGVHALRLEHFQIDGYAAFKARIVPAR